MSNLADALRAFYDTTVELGVAEPGHHLHRLGFRPRAHRRTTTAATTAGAACTSSLGGAVRGKQFYGINPTLANNGPDDIGQGRLIPTTSVDQYAATLASWFGVSASNLTTVVPNINNYAGSPLGTNVGFVQLVARR